MGVNKEKTVIETYKKLLEVGFGEGSIEEMPEFIAEDVMGYGTAFDEKILSIKEFVELIHNQRKQAAQFESFEYASNPVIIRLAENEQSAVVVDEIELVTVLDGKSNQLQVRMSTVMELKDKSWIITHWHGSLAEHVSDGEDPWHVNQWKQRTEKLEKMVDEKTADLAKKNRDLEIEAALERVRTVAMSMRKPDDLLDVCEVISDQLELLNVADIRNTQVAIIDEAKKHYLNYQYFTPYSEKVFEVTEYEHNPASQEMVVEMKKSANSFFTGSMQGKELKTFSEWRKKYKQYPDPLLDKFSEVHYYFYSIGNGGLGLTTYKAINEGDLNVFKRFHKVFELAYRRFQDIEQAETQAREARIEAALEKVRAQTMAMHTSQELEVVIKVINDQLVQLKILVEHAGFIMDYKKQDGMHIWLADPNGAPSQVNIPYFDSVINSRFKEAKTKGLDFLAVNLTYEEKNDHYRKLFKHIPELTEEAREFYFSCPGLALSIVLLEDVALYIENFSGISYSDEENSILRRFGKVFQQAYTRFLDLKKAERQAREAQIEAALEKVRSRSLAMRKAEELGEVVTVVVEKLRELELPVHDGVAIVTHIEGSKDQTEWMENPGFPAALKFYQPYFDHPVLADYWKAKNEGLDFIAPRYTAEENRSFLNHIFEFTDYKHTPQEIKDYCLAAKAYSYSAAFQKNSSIFINDYSGRPLTKQEIDIVKRFSKVFEQAYTRFLDLQKAEAQAREAGIEAALERIRGQVTGMKESAELLGIMVKMRAEFVSLGHEAHYFWYMRYLPDTYEKAMTSGDGTRIGMVMTLPRHIHGDIKLIADWEKSDEPAVVFAMDVETAVDYVHKMITLGDFVQVDPNAPTLDDIRHIGGLTFVMARSQYGEIGFSLPGKVPNPPKESIKTLVRFAGVFDLAYRRFEDIKNTEARARETQIELALERVRARTMAMHQTSELQDVINAVHQQFKNLDIHITGGAFIAINSEITKELLCWGAGGTADYIQRVHVPYIKRPIYTNLVEGIKKGPGFFTESFTQEEKVEFFKHLFKKPPYNKASAARKKEVMGRQGGYTRSCIVSKHTSIFIINHHGREFSDEENDILKRFGKVFEQTYTRFLDLQKAEEQAREAQIEAALERVRAKAMAMHSSEDLATTVDAFFSELEGLDVKPHRCGMGIIDAETRKVSIQSTTTNAQNKRDKVTGQLTLSGHPVLENIYKNWKLQKEYFPVLRGHEISDYYKVMDPEIAFPPFAEDEIQYGYYFYFNEGGVYAWTDTKLEEKDLQIFRRYNSVLSLALRRYFDLKEAEAQAREAQIEAGLERVRSRTLAMQSSDELAETAAVLFRQLIQLGIAPNRLYISIVKDDKGNMEFWITDEDGSKVSTGYSTNKDNNPTFKKMYAGWASRKKSLTIDLRGKALQHYFQELMAIHVPFQDGLKQKRRVQNIAYFSGGFIGIASAGDQPEETRNLLERFAAVFNLTYTRFSDLKLAEAKTREAKIEAALERVRARAMAMQQPEELKEVAQVMRQEMGMLGIEELETSSIYIKDENSPEAECWYAIKDIRKKKKKLVSDYFGLNLNDTGVGREMLKFYNSDEKQTSIVMQGAERKEWIRYCEKRSVPLSGYYGEVIPDRTYHLYKFSQGAIGAATAGGFSEENWGLLRRAASVFSLAYSRFRDLTQARLDLMHLKEEKKRAEDALKNLKSTQNQLIHAEKMASLGELTAGIAHEIQNPLNFVNNFSEVSVDLMLELNEEMESGDEKEIRALAEDIKQNLEKIHHHGRRASEIVKGMLEHSRSSKGEKIQTNINTLADEYLRLAYHGLRAKDKSFNADFVAELDKKLPEVKVIPQDFGRVLLNLINNAFFTVSEKAKQSNQDYKPKVIVKTKCINDKIVIGVKDNGNGIPEEIREKIFQPFFTTKPTGEGTGLGLSLSFDIISKGHGGELKVITKVGEGSEFIIELPTNN